MTRIAIRAAAVVSIPALCLTAAACSSSGTSPSASPSSSNTAPTASPSSSIEYKTTELTANDVTVADVGPNMKVTFPFPSEAQKLSTKDIKVGTGAVVKATDTIDFYYYLASATTGEKIEANFGDAAPYPSPLSGLIKGWQEGLPGMKVGGQRILVVPQALAYQGQAGAPAGTLVFVLQVDKATAAAK